MKAVIKDLIYNAVDNYKRRKTALIELLKIEDEFFKCNPDKTERLLRRLNVAILDFKITFWSSWIGEKQ